MLTPDSYLQVTGRQGFRRLRACQLRLSPAARQLTGQETEERMSIPVANSFIPERDSKGAKAWIVDREYL